VLFNGENRSMLCGRAAMWESGAVSRTSMPSAAADAAWGWEPKCSSAMSMLLVSVSSSNGIGTTVEVGSCVGYVVTVVVVSVVSTAPDVLDLSDKSMSVTGMRASGEGSEGRFPTSVIEVAAVLARPDELGSLLLVTLLEVIL